jgi:hypothetical protein
LRNPTHVHNLARSDASDRKHVQYLKLRLNYSHDTQLEDGGRTAVIVHCCPTLICPVTITYCTRRSPARRFAACPDPWAAILTFPEPPSERSPFLPQHRQHGTSTIKVDRVFPSICRCRGHIPLLLLLRGRLRHFLLLRHGCYISRHHPIPILEAKFLPPKRSTTATALITPVLQSHMALCWGDRSDSFNLCPHQHSHNG